MKKLFSIILALAFLAVAASAFAVDLKQVTFATFSTSANSSAINATKFRHKTVTFQGYSSKSATNPSLMSGTALVQCAPTPNGPWQTCQNEAGTAISSTTSKTVQWSDVVSYIRVKWTNTARCMRAWINLYSD